MWFSIVVTGALLCAGGIIFFSVIRPTLLVRIYRRVELE